MPNQGEPLEGGQTTAAATAAPTPVPAPTPTPAAGVPAPAPAPPSAVPASAAAATATAAATTTTNNNVDDNSSSNNNDNNNGEITSTNQEEGNPDLNNWLPITASRKAKWWYSTFHNITAMVGAGVLGLPYAVSQLGWIAGLTVIVLSWIVTYYSLWQLVQLHESVPGKRFDRYPELGMHAFGPKLGYWVVMPQQLLVQMASDIVYMVTGGKSLKKFFDLLIPAAESIRETYFILAYAILELGLSQTPNFNSLKAISLLAAVMSCCYSFVAFFGSAMHGLHSRKHHEPAVDYRLRSYNSTPGIIFDIFNGLGTIAFAFAGHSVALEIQATIPSTPEKPSKVPMWKGAILAYIILGMCYFWVAVSGYWAFGRKVEDDILISLERPIWMVSAANLMVFIHVLGSYQVFAMPVFDLIESYLVKKKNFKPGRPLRIVARSTYVAMTALVGICLPFFGGLLGFFGGLAYTSTSYFLPCVIWLALKKPEPFTKHWLACWFCIFFGGIITVVAPIGGMRQIIVSAKGYKIFS